METKHEFQAHRPSSHNPPDLSNIGPGCVVQARRHGFFETIAADTLVLVDEGNMKAAEKRITDFETAWDEAEPSLYPKDRPLGAQSTMLPTPRSRRACIAARSHPGTESRVRTHRDAEEPDRKLNYSNLPNTSKHIKRRMPERKKSCSRLLSPAASQSSPRSPTPRSPARKTLKEVRAARDAANACRRRQGR